MVVVGDAIDPFCVGCSFTGVLSAMAWRFARLAQLQHGSDALGVDGAPHPLPLHRFPIHARIRGLAVDLVSLAGAVWAVPPAMVVTHVVAPNDIPEVAEDFARPGSIARVAAPVGAEPPERVLSVSDGRRRASAGRGLGRGAFPRGTSLRTMDTDRGAAPVVATVASLPP